MLYCLKLVVCSLLLIQKALNSTAQGPNDVDLYQFINPGETFYIYNPEYPYYTSPAGLKFRGHGEKPSDIFVLDCEIALPRSVLGTCIGAYMTVRKGLSLIPEVYCGHGTFNTTSTQDDLIVMVNILPGFTGRFFCTFKVVDL